MKDKFNEALSKLGSWVKVIEKGMLGLVVVESIIVFTIGVASSNLYHDEYPQVFIWILLTSILLYLLIIGFRYSYEKKFPSSIVDELKANYQLEKINDKLNRNILVNETINLTIDSMSSFDPEELISNYQEINPVEVINEEVKKIISPFSEGLNNIFSDSTSKFTAGFLLIDRKTRIEVNKNRIPNLFIFRDDLKIKEFIEEDVLKQENLKGWVLELQSFFKSCINHDSYELSVFRKDFVGKVAICNPVKVERGIMSQSGILFIISNQNEEDIPIDAQSIISVFSNLISSWVEMFTLTVLSSSIRKIGKSIGKIFSGSTKEKDDNTEKKKIEEKKEHDSESSRRLRP